MTDKPVGIRIDGLDRIYNKMTQQTEQAARAGLRKGLLAGGEVIRLAMKRFARRGWHIWSQRGSKGQGRSRDFGFISDHMGKKTTISNREQTGNVDIFPVKKGYWALFMEFGTSKMGAIPFARPAIESTRETAVTAFADSLKKTLEDELTK